MILLAVFFSGLVFTSDWSLIWAYPIALIASIWAQLGCLEEVHDGVHNNILSSRKANNRIATAYAALTGMSFPAYRQMHMGHHMHFTRQDDPDYFAYSKRPSGVSGWLSYIFSYLSGYQGVRGFLSPETGSVEVKRQSSDKMMILYAQLGLFLVSSLMIGPWWYIFCWLAPLPTITLGLTRFRTLLEHWEEADSAGDKPIGSLWNLKGRFWSQVFASPFGYNYHGWHHLYPDIPNYRLHQVEGIVGSSLGDEAPDATSFPSRIKQVMGSEKLQSDVVDSDDVTSTISSSGNLRFYLSNLINNPKKIFGALWDTFLETFRFVFFPRIDVRLSFIERLKLVIRFVYVELKIPGATFLIEFIWLVYALNLFKTPVRNWVEVGLYKGLSTVRFSILADHYDARIFAFDTFEGLPGGDVVYETVNESPAYFFASRSYMGSMNEVVSNLETFGNYDRVDLVAGDVKDTMAGALKDKVSFAFLDVDLVESYQSCFEGLAPCITDGSVIVIAEAAFKPVRDLVEDEVFWGNLGCGAPKITYVEDKYGLHTCQNLAFLCWGDSPL